MSQEINFIKMNGAGNDFIIFDEGKLKEEGYLDKYTDLELDKEQIEAISARDNKITRGCDQLLILKPSTQADVFMKIYNADGGEVDACGNATRCVGWLIMDDKKTTEASIQTKVDILHCYDNDMLGKTIPLLSNASGRITADMGIPKFGWQDIPLSEACDDTLHVPLKINGLNDPVCVSMGNPHVVFFVDDVKKMDLIEDVGKKLQNHPLFPKKVNVSIAYIRGEDIMMRVWERGVGLTASCGTGACAVTVAAIKRGLIDATKQHQVRLQNINEVQLLMVWQKGNHVFLHGAVETEFSGKILLD